MISTAAQLRGGIALMAAALAGILVANSPLAESYQWLWQQPLVVQLGEFAIDKPLLLWVNDGLMAVFFLLVALELKREILDGELSSRAQVLLPLVAALGGIIVPAAIYLAWNSGDPIAAEGWAVPAATDIAFALGVLAILGKRVPIALKAFLLSVAVFDDLGAILIIATLYTEDISWTAKGLALLASALLFVVNRLGGRRISVYLLVGLVLWVCVLKSGVHATLAGVVLGLTIPHRPRGSRESSALLTCEHALQPWVGLVVVPVFAFANSGLSLTGLGTSLLDPVAVGIAVGLFFGKLIGVFGAAALAIRLGWAQLPRDSGWGAFLGVCLLSGIGFTMSLFIGTLAFEHSGRDLGAPLRLGVLLGSLASAVAGYTTLRISLGRKRQISAGDRACDSVAGP